MPANASTQEVEARGSRVHSELTGYTVTLRPAQNVLDSASGKQKKHVHTKIPTRFGEQKVNFGNEDY